MILSTALARKLQTPHPFKELNFVVRFFFKISWQEVWEKDYPKEQWMAVLVCSSKAESRVKYYFLKRKSNIFNFLKKHHVDMGLKP